MEYIFRTLDNIHVLRIKDSQNSKLGEGNMLHTYHFSIDQVRFSNLKLDGSSCLDCPLSYTNSSEEGESGGCYTHKGFMGMGLRSMLKRLNKLWHKGKIEVYSAERMNSFLGAIEFLKPELIRFGVYGEPVLLPIQVVQKLSHISPYTGYTHQWSKPEYQQYRHFFMASTHNSFETAIANDMGWRTFNVGILDNAVNCPASKEAGKKTTCVSCKLCNGSNGNSKKNIYINPH